MASIRVYFETAAITTLDPGTPGQTPPRATWTGDGTVVNFLLSNGVPYLDCFTGKLNIPRGLVRYIKASSIRTVVTDPEHVSRIIPGRHQQRGATATVKREYRGNTTPAFILDIEIAAPTLEEATDLDNAILAGRRPEECWGEAFSLKQFRSALARLLSHAAERIDVMASNFANSTETL